MPNYKNINRILSKYEISNSDLLELETLIKPYGNLQDALDAKHRYSSGIENMSELEAVPSLNLEFSGNGNLRAFLTMHDFFNTRPERKILSQCVNYTIKNEQMIFDTKKPLIFFDDGASVIEYFTNLARYKPLLFQYFLINSMNENARDTANWDAKISNVKPPEESVIEVEALFDGEMNNAARNFSLFFFSAIGKQQLVNYIVQNNSDIFINNKNLAETVKIFNKVSDETIEMFKEKANLINVEFLDKKLDHELKVVNEFANYDTFDRTASDLSTILTTKTNVAFENLTHKEGDGTPPSKNAEEAYNITKGRLLANNFNLFASEFRSILLSDESDDVKRNRMKDWNSKHKRGNALFKTAYLSKLNEFGVSTSSATAEQKKLAVAGATALICKSFFLNSEVIAKNIMNDLNAIAENGDLKASKFGICFLLPDDIKNRQFAVFYTNKTADLCGIADDNKVVSFHNTEYEIDYKDNFEPKSKGSLMGEVNRIRSEYRAKDALEHTPESAALAASSDDEIITTFTPEQLNWKTKVENNLVIDTKPFKFAFGNPEDALELRKSNLWASIKHFDPNYALKFYRKNNNEIKSLIGFNKYGQQIKFSKNTFGNGYTKEYLDDQGNSYAYSKKNTFFSDVKLNNREKIKICQDLITKFDKCKVCIFESDDSAEKKEKASRLEELIALRISKITNKDPIQIMNILSDSNTKNPIDVFQQIARIPNTNSNENTSPVQQNQTGQTLRNE